MNMIEVKTAELSGPALDYAVAIATEAWKSAHTLYPTMTLDPSFSGVEARPYPRGEFGSSLMTCVLVPNNPFRQDPQPFCPSTEWSHGGRLIDKFKVQFERLLSGNYRAQATSSADSETVIGCPWETGDDHLKAACRAIVGAHLGDTVQIPAELLP